MVSGLRMLEQAPDPYCQQLSRKGDNELACTLTAAFLTDGSATCAGRDAGKDGSALRLPTSLSVTGFPDRPVCHDMKSLCSFSYVWTRMQAIDSCIDMDDLPAVTGIVVYPHNVISAPAWPHPNAVGKVP